MSYVYMFIQKSRFSFTIVANYVDDINLTRTHDEIERTTGYLKRKFETEDQVLFWFRNSA